MKTRSRKVFAAATAFLLGAMVMTGSGALAQGATPVSTVGRPAHIHEGNCPDPGNVVQPLNNLMLATGDVSTPGTPVADTTGAIPGEYSFTTVPMTIDDMLAGEFVINVHESATAIDVYLACGDIGGTVDANGSLVIGLSEVSDSGFTGIAVLSPNPTTAGSTDVSVFIAPGLMDDQNGNGK